MQELVCTVSAKNTRACYQPHAQPGPTHPAFGERLEPKTTPPHQSFTALELTTIIYLPLIHVKSNGTQNIKLYRSSRITCRRQRGPPTCVLGGRRALTGASQNRRARCARKRTSRHAFASKLQQKHHMCIPQKQKGQINNQTRNKIIRGMLNFNVNHIPNLLLQIII